MPVTLSGKVVIVTWWIFCIVFLAVYSGTLVAYLAVTVVNLPFTTLEGMVAQTTYKWAIPQGIMLNNVLEVRIISLHLICELYLESVHCIQIFWNISKAINVELKYRTVIVFTVCKQSAWNFMYRACNLVHSFILQHSSNPIYRKLFKYKVAADSYNTAYQHIVGKFGFVNVSYIFLIFMYIGAYCNEICMYPL